MYFRTLSVTVLVASLAAVSQAVVINGSFEEPFQVAGHIAVPIPGWSQTVGDSGVWVVPDAVFNINAPDGRQIFYSNGPSLAQQLSVEVVEGVQTATVMAGRRGDGFAGSFRFSLVAGGTVANGVVTGGTVLDSIEFDHTAVAPTSWTLLTLSYEALAGDAHIGEKVSLAFELTAGTQYNIDDVRFESEAVPEPATLALLALAPLALKRRKKA